MADPQLQWRDAQGNVYEKPGRGRRAFADFREYAEVGGGREALAEPGKAWGTKDPEVARRLFAARLQELTDRRHGRVFERPKPRTTTFTDLAADHLIKKAKAGTSAAHLQDLQSRLQAAALFFGRDRDLRTIEPKDVRAWMELLGKGGRKPGTVRHYLNALSGLYRRAQEGLFVEPKYNPVAALVEKPTGKWKGEAAFLEIADAALVLEAARIVEKRDRVNATPGLYAIIATFLLTGGRKSEVLGLDVDDVSFDRGLIHFRPNAHRGLKTQTSHRVVPLWPQLREILQEHLFGGASPRTSGLLFPPPAMERKRKGWRPVDLRKSLDDIAELCGMDAGELRTRRFRHTYCSVRLQTVQRIVKPGKDPATDPDPYEYVEVSKFQVQKEMGHGGAQLVDRIYGHGLRSPHRLEAVEYQVERHREELGERLRALEVVG